ncbi:MAG: hypothetical protein GEV09_11510 [Pseudonocardiaceae bacterium]|nr:hypothetical protein [Pseudonocardiaceae bacterium]
MARSVRSRVPDRFGVTAFGVTAFGVTAFGVSVALAAASIAVPALIHHPLTRGDGELRRYLDVFVDSNLPAWWSTGVLLVAALGHATAGVASRIARIPGAWCWWVGAAVLAVLSLDEHTQLYERTGVLGDEIAALTGWPYPVAVAGSVAGLGVTATLAVLATRVRAATRWLLVAGVATVAGCAAAAALAQDLLLSGGVLDVVAVLAYHAGWLGGNVGALLLLTAARSAVSVIPEGAGIRLRYHTATPPPAVAPHLVGPQRNGVPA